MRTICATLSVILFLSVSVKSNAQATYKAAEVVADTTLELNNRSQDVDMFAFNDLSSSLGGFSADFFNEAMNALKNMPTVDFSLPNLLDSLQCGQNSFVDSLGNARKFDRSMAAGRHRHHGRFEQFSPDSLGQNQSIVVLSDGKKTTIIKNGKDTTVVDGFQMPDMPDFPDFPDMFSSVPSRHMNPDRFMRNFDMRFNSNGDEAGMGDFVAENPSEEELSMLSKNGLISSSSLNKPLDVIDLKLMFNRRSNTVSLDYRLADIAKSNIKVVDKDGKQIEMATLLGNNGSFRRTFKMDDKQQYIYIIISASSKFAVSKFWI